MRAHNINSLTYEKPASVVAAASIAAFIKRGNVLSLSSFSPCEEIPIIQRMKR